MSTRCSNYSIFISIVSLTCSISYIIIINNYQFWYSIFTITCIRNLNYKICSIIIIRIITNYLWSRRSWSRYICRSTFQSSMFQIYTRLWCSRLIRLCYYNGINNCCSAYSDCIRMEIYFNIWTINICGECSKTTYISMIQRSCHFCII